MRARSAGQLGGLRYYHLAEGAAPPSVKGIHWHKLGALFQRPRYYFLTNEPVPPSPGGGGSLHADQWAVIQDERDIIDIMMIIARALDCVH